MCGSGVEWPVQLRIWAESARRREWRGPFAGEQPRIIAFVREGNEWVAPAALGGNPIRQAAWVKQPAQLWTVPVNGDLANRRAGTQPPAQSWHGGKCG